MWVMIRPLGGGAALSGKKVGLLINFNMEHLKDGIIRLVNEFCRSGEGTSALLCVLRGEILSFTRHGFTETLHRHGGG